LFPTRCDRAVPGRNAAFTSSGTEGNRENRRVRQPSRALDQNRETSICEHVSHGRNKAWEYLTYSCQCLPWRCPVCLSSHSYRDTPPPHPSPCPLAAASDRPIMQRHKPPHLLNVEQFLKSTTVLVGFTRPSRPTTPCQTQNRTPSQEPSWAAHDTRP